MTTPQYELVITRDVPVPAAKLYQGWTDPALMKQWFVPKPWSIARIRIDVRAGGSSEIVMRSPEGQEFPNQGSISKSCRMKNSSSPMPTARPGFPPPIRL